MSPASSLHASRPSIAGLGGALDGLTGGLSTLASLWREHITAGTARVKSAVRKASVATLLASDSRCRASMVQIFQVIALALFRTRAMSESLRLFTAYVGA
ncbi:hypothetical protein PTNB73_08294 [Pyrenophora teres f. teres]|uniref:Uncharacterized protein n=1 Tax=Pyrenophora teres f. teres (strain 0-1) TaxID=861557 RepID=E3S9T9_PYRTT|nr:hypothetical protein PTT_19833 [Pyrenophora teres f. teres 0-1]KAE8834390.1 hypothetical protein PTNB85_05723 [Pyrenophora teres f. teres]KAE8858814.1 hypothetical protein PTNB73_08294 [Pyrenophora teres f. teres]